MAVRANTNAPDTYIRRTRNIWTVLVISLSLFCAILAAGGASLYSFLSSVTQPAQARVQLIRGTQLTVIRQGRLDREAVQNETSLSEGDKVETGPDTEANIDFFDGSTALLSFNTQVRLADLHTNRFFGDRKEMTLDTGSGTVLFSTTDRAGYSSVHYNVTTPQAEVRVAPNSTVRVNVAGSEDMQTTEAAVSTGSAEVASGGKTVQLSPSQKTTAAANSAPTEPQPDEVELIRNGDFTQPPTSRAEGPETGLNTAAWLPVIEQSVGDTLGVGNVTITTESVGDQSVRAARIDRQGDGNRYGKVGLRQEINKSVSYFHLVELTSTVKAVAQTEPVGGPQEDVFPLTIKVLYTTPDNHQREWKHSFYYCAKGYQACKMQDNSIEEHDNASEVRLGQYEVPEIPLVLKRIGGGIPNNNSLSTPPGTVGEPAPTSAPALPDIGQDIAVINAIEIYGLGDKFQSWITDVSLTAR